MANIRGYTPNSKKNLAPISKVLLRELLYDGLVLGMWAAVHKLAAKAWNDECHLRAGAKTNEWKGRKRKQVLDDEDDRTDPGPRIKAAYSDTTLRERRRLQKAGPDHPIVITCTKYGLLKAIKASDNSGNLKQVLPALKRLAEPIRGERTRPSLITKITEVDGKLELIINPLYLCGKQVSYEWVPVPLPLHDVHILRAYMFCHYIHADNLKGTKSVGTRFLLEQIGVDEGRSRKEIDYNFARAWDGMNKHLEKIGQPYKFEWDHDEETHNSLKIFKLPRTENQELDIKAQIDAEIERREQAAVDKERKEAWAAYVAEMKPRRKKRVKPKPEPVSFFNEDEELDHLDIEAKKNRDNRMKRILAS